MIGRIRNMLTFEGLAFAIFDYTDMVEDMVETCCALVEDSLKAASVFPGSRASSHLLSNQPPQPADGGFGMIPSGLVVSARAVRSRFHPAVVRKPLEVTTDG